jgi:hypothetical protein
LSGRTFRPGRSRWALSDSPCWFGLSAAQGGLNSEVYLGLFDIFGIASPKEPERGLARIKQAADAGPIFAMMYLADIHRFGIVGRPDPGLAQTWKAKVMQRPNCIDVMTQSDEDRYQACVSSRNAAEENLVLGERPKYTILNPEELLPELSLWERDGNSVISWSETKDELKGLGLLYK